MITKVFTILSTVVIILVDLFFVFTGRETISEYIYELSKNYPIVATGFGVLIGHWFWPIRDKK